MSNAIPGGRVIDSTPKRGTRWRHPRYRSVWTISSVGPKYVTLKPSVPDFPLLKVDRVMWPGSWERW